MRPSDDLRHALTPGPYSRESLFYNVVLPELGVMVFVYTWVDAADRAGHLVTVIGDDDKRHAFSAVDGVQVGGRDFDDWEVAGLRLRHADLLRTAEISFDDGAGFSLRLEFTGVHEAFNYLRNADGCPSFIADDRFEQAGRVVGELTVDGRTTQFDTMGHRDHSWGQRDWDSFQDWKWISAQASDGLCLNVMQVHARGETTHHGYVYRDGTVEPVVDLRARAEYDENWWQTTVHLTVCDAAGRETVLSAKRFALLRFEAGEKLALHEAGCTGTIDGQDAICHFEAGWERAYAAGQAERVAAELRR